nr:hypothetical protein [Tanacetum cinerariifolium]
GEHNIDFHPMVDFIEASLLRQYTRRARIAQSSALPTVVDEPASPLRDVSQGEACPTDSSFIADQDRETIDKSSSLPHDSAPRVTSPLLMRADVEINRLKERVKMLEDREGVAVTRSRDDAPIKGRSMDEEEEATERISDDSVEMATVLTSMDAATVLASGVVDVPTGSGSIPTASTPAEEQVPTGSDVVPTASLVFATVVTPYRRRKGKEVMVESKNLKKQKVQEQIDARVVRELEEQLEREDQRRSAQIARDAEIARIHAEEELQIMIDRLDINNDTVAKYLQEYHQFALELPIERRIELITDLVKYQDNYAKIYKYQSWKVKDFRGMTFEEVEAKFNLVWKQMEDFIPMGSKEESEMIKRKGLSLEQESAKKQKTSEEVPEEAMSLEEVPKEKKITRLGGSSASYQFFIDLIKHLDREDLNQLWRLVKETLSNKPPTSNKEMELWVELSRLYEPDNEDQLWTHKQNCMHAPVEWKLYNTCGVHHVTSKDKEIFMLVEKDYPLRKGLALVMISYKLQVENYSQMANDLILKIYKIANSPRQQVQAVGETDDSPVIPEHTIVETPMNMYPVNKAHFQEQKEAIHLIMTGIGNEIYSNVDAYQTAQEMWEDIKRLQQGKEIAKPITPPSETAFEEDSDPEQAQRDKEMQKNLALIAKKPKRVKDSAYHKEKMLLCKQAEQGVPLQDEQYDWLADTDEEIDEQELEAHYRYMSKIQEVPTTDSGIDSKPLEQVQNDARYNVFANDLQHSEQSKSISNTCLVETNDSKVIPDSPDMCNDDIQNDQNDVESNDEHVALTNLIDNLKLDVDENKKIQNQIKKANTTLAQEFKECKTILIETSKTLRESNSVQDSCLVALQNKQTEFEKYKAFSDRTVDYDILERKLNETLGQLAQKDIEIIEGLKTKAYEISVVKEKHDELIKQSLLTKSHYEGLLK